MFGLGTIINCSAIVIAGIAGMVFGNHLKESMQDTLWKVDGVAVINLWRKTHMLRVG